MQRLACIKMVKGLNVHEMLCGILYKPKYDAVVAQDRSS